jgi:uncharacterized protein involved in exopolysaccharide biosynthesis
MRSGAAALDLSRLVTMMVSQSSRPDAGSSIQQNKRDTRISTGMENPLADSRSDTDFTGVALESYTAVFFRYRWWIAATALLGAIAGLALAASRPPMFESMATVAIVPPSLPDDTVPAVRAERLRVFFTDRAVTSRVLSETGLDRHPYAMTAGAFLRDRLIVEDVVPTSVLRIRVRLPDGALAVKVCNRLVAVAIEARAGETLAERDLIKRQLDASRERLDVLGSRLVAFRTQAQIEVLREDIRRRLLAVSGLTRPSRDQLAELYEREIEQARLQSEYDAAARVYEELLARHERIQVTSGSAGLKVTDPAVAATSAARPSSTVSTTLGAAAGLGLGTLLAFIVEFVRARPNLELPWVVRT